VEHDGIEPDGLSLQALTLARGLAETLGLPLHAILIGDTARSPAARLSAYGVATAHVVAHERMGEYAPRAWARGIASLVDELAPTAVVAAGSDRGNELMAHVGSITGLAMAANCTRAETGEPWRVTRIRWGGSLLEDATLSGLTKLLTVAPHAVQAEERAPVGEVHVVTGNPAIDEEDLLVRVVDRVAADASGVSLPEARVVVGGGRGVGSAEGFRVLEELAALLGGTVGVSRVVTSQGWRPHTDQIGQTGARIAPDLYIACGISGAIQHMVGCKAAKKILVINTDPDAPILARADYAVIGDLHAVVPALIEQIRGLRGG
jgi:electron transfer flavoprotein alpha subunit